MKTIDPLEELDECKRQILIGFETEEDRDELVKQLRALADWFEQDKYLE